MSEQSAETQAPARQLSGVQRLMEVGLILCCGFAMFLMLSLFSFDPADPGWSQTGQSNQVRNAGGAIGAFLADILFFSLGFVAYLIPFAAAFTGWWLFHRSRDLMQVDYLTLGLKTLGAVLLLLSSTALASMNLADLHSYSAGGGIGDLLSSRLLPFLNFVGTTVLMLCFFFTGFTLLTGISWIYIIDRTGEMVIRGARWVYLKAKQQWQDRQSAPMLTAPDAEVEPTNEQDLTISFASEKEENGTNEKEPDAETEEQEKVSAGKKLAALMPWNNKTPERESEASVSAEDEEEPYLDINQIIDEPISLAADKGVSPQEVETALEKVQPIETNAVDAARVVPAPVPAAPKAPVPEGELPSLELLDRPDKAENPISQEELDRVSRLVEAKLADFNVEVKVVDVFPGPVITRFELDLAPGVKVSKISNLSKDLARALSAVSVRVVEVIPGKSVIGLELPNKHREIVRLSEVIACKDFEQSPSALTMVLGKDISGEPVVVDLAKMPHLLVAGTTGSGKSVGVNTMILSLLYKSSPEDVRLIMIDPKMLELSVYEGIPHLLAEVVTDMKEAANALRWCVGEMERRYKLMSALGVRNLKGYNAKVTEAIANGNPIVDPLWKPGDSMDEMAPTLEKLPAIVVIVDEFADMMMIVGKKVEELIARIAQKARAAGIHLVLATQRPSVDVITGLIKANIPTRIAFQVSSRIDSRTILDQQGAEQLLGQGDMLYLPPGSGVPTRVHGAFVDDHEVHAVVADWKSRGEPNYLEEVLSGDLGQEGLLPGEQAEDEDTEMDALYDEAVAFVTETRKASVSSVQRKFRIGYNRAARLVEQMEMSGVVSPAGHNGAREVLAPPPVKV